MEASDPQIMTIDEVATYLRVSERTVSDWASKGQIPGGKLGTAWRFKREDVDRWLNDRLRSAPKAESARPLSLSHLIKPERILVLDGQTKQEVLEALIHNLAQASEVHDRDALADAVYRREELMSTGIGKGVAVPHVRIPSVSNLVMSVGLVPGGVDDYASLDSDPIRLVFLIAARETQHAQHLRTLSSISAIVRDPVLLSKICSASDVDTLHDLLTVSAQVEA